MSTILLIIGLVLTALMAGVYFSFSVAVMPGLRRTDDTIYVTATQRINESILNPVFLLTFLLALVVPVVAIFFHLGGDGRPRLAWIITGAVLYGATIVTTAALNIPLNNKLAAAGDIDEESAPGVRAAFHDRWVRFNTLRAVLALGAVVMLATALTR